MDYNQYYDNTKDVFGKEPEKILVEYNHLIPPGKTVLDIGAGQGRNTIYLSKLGFDVEAIDTSTSSIRILNDLKTSGGYMFKTSCSNFKNYSAERKYSAVLVFGLIQILDHGEINLLMDKLSGWLDKDGLVFATAFTTADDSHKIIADKSERIGINSYIKPDGEKRTFLEPVELKSMFARYEAVHYREYTGPYHRHGNSSLQRHELAEGVFRKIT